MKILTLLMTLLLLPSCVWNIGGVIRANSAVNVGADTLHPVNGEIYTKKGKDGYERVYMYAPEVTYQIREHFIKSSNSSVDSSTEVYGIVPTGRIVAVESTYGATLVDQIPPDVTKRSMTEKNNGLVVPRISTVHSIGRFTDSDKSSSGSVMGKVIAAPFDYAIDPVLTVSTSLVAGVVGGVIELFDLIVPDGGFAGSGVGSSEPEENSTDNDFNTPDNEPHCKKGGHRGKPCHKRRCKEKHCEDGYHH